MVSPLFRVWQPEKLSDVSLATRPRCSLVVDEDVTKSLKKMNIRITFYHLVNYSLVLYQYRALAFSSNKNTSVILNIYFQDTVLGTMVCVPFVQKDRGV